LWNSVETCKGLIFVACLALVVVGGSSVGKDSKIHNCNFIVEMWKWIGLDGVCGVCMGQSWHGNWSGGYCGGW
jgi:hypothetical protein